MNRLDAFWTKFYTALFLWVPMHLVLRVLHLRMTLLPSQNALNISCFDHHPRSCGPQKGFRTWAASETRDRAWHSCFLEISPPFVLWSGSTLFELRALFLCNLL